MSAAKDTFFDGRWLVAGACYGRSESTLHPLPVRGEPLSAFEPSEATGAFRPFSRPKVGKHGFDSPTGFVR